MDDPASADPRAFRTTDADGRPLAVFVGDDDYVWLSVGGELTRLRRDQAVTLGGRIMGAARRARPMRPGAPEG